MDELSVLDLQNLRHLIGGYETSHKNMLPALPILRSSSFSRNLPSRPCRTNSSSCSFSIKGGF